MLSSDTIVILDSIVVSIPACHAGDRGSIPRRGDNLFFSTRSDEAAITMMLEEENATAQTIATSTIQSHDRDVLKERMLSTLNQADSSTPV